MQGKKIFESASLLFEFYNQLLCSIYVKTPHLFDKILVKDYDLNNDKDIKRLISTEKVLYHAHWIVISASEYVTRASRRKKINK